MSEKAEQPAHSTFVTPWFDGGEPSQPSFSVVTLRRKEMPEYLKRSEILAVLDAAQEQQSTSAKAEEEKAAGNMGMAISYNHAARVLIVVADIVRELPAASLEEKEE